MNYRTKLSPLDMPMEKEVFHNFKLTYDKLVYELVDLFKGYGITITQYDVLETITNAGKIGIPILKLSERMLSRQPDVTRIIDRLEDLGFVTRVRDTKDRRVVYVRLSRSGLALCEKVESSLYELHRDQFGHLSKSEMKFLNQLFSKIRDSADYSGNRVTSA